MAAKQQLRRHVALEICHSDMQLAVATETAPGEFSVDVRTIRWRQNVSSLLVEGGKQELIAALQESLPAQRENTTLDVSLNGNFCVTRVVVGENDAVERELENVEGRSKLYLALGHGRKTTAHALRKIDGRHQHALVSVVNQRTLDVLAEVAKTVGIRLDIVEPSLVSLARLQGLAEDTSGPALVIDVGERGAEVGIVQHGSLYLDYRLPDVEDETEVATIIGRHLHRLQRYYDRYIRLGRGNIQQGLLCGEAVRLDAVSSAFERQGTLQTSRLHELTTRLPCQFTSPPGPAHCALLGILVRRWAPREDLPVESPNLVTNMRLSDGDPLAPRLIRALWPVAAALLLTMGVEGANMLQRWSCAKWEGQAATAEEAQTRLATVDALLKRDTDKLTYFDQIRTTLDHTNWGDFTKHLGQCLPDDAWLETVSVDKTGKVGISGVSFSQDGVFEFVKWLNELPDVRYVSLAGTEAKRIAAGPATSFEVSCEVAK